MVLTSDLFDTTTKEGKLLYAAICILKQDGPEDTRGKETIEIIGVLGETVDMLERFKM